jgi:hypothetical protein
MQLQPNFKGLSKIVGITVDQEVEEKMRIARK